MRGSGLKLLLLVGIALAGCTNADVGLEEDETGATSDELIGASIDTDHRFAVGVCTGVVNADGSCPVPGTPNTSRCSGTLVMPNLVLTARHCVERVAAQPDPADFCSVIYGGISINSSVSITTGDSVLLPNNKWHAVQKIYTPSGNSACIDDFVLLQLGTPVRDVRPVGIDLRRNVVENPPAKLAIVGRGWIKQQYDPETFKLVEADDGGLRRRVKTSIPFICAPATKHECTVPDYWSDPPTMDLWPGQFAYGPVTASGDSGAGVYENSAFKAKSFMVIGVHSMSTMAADGRNSANQGVRMDRHAPFIRDAVAQAALAGGYPVPLWAE